MRWNRSLATLVQATRRQLHYYAGQFPQSGEPTTVEAGLGVHGYSSEIAIIVRASDGRILSIVAMGVEV